MRAELYRGSVSDSSRTYHGDSPMIGTGSRTKIIGWIELSIALLRRVFFIGEAFKNLTAVYSLMMHLIKRKCKTFLNIWTLLQSIDFWFYDSTIAL